MLCLASSYAFFVSTHDFVYDTPHSLLACAILSQVSVLQLLSYLNDYKIFLNDLTSNELLCYVYSAYPEMTDESVEYKRLLPIMKDTILNLVKK